MTNEERSVDALIAAFRPLIEGAARAAREKRAMRRARSRKSEAIDGLCEPEVDGCLCFRCAPCAWCLRDASASEVSQTVAHPPASNAPEPENKA